MASYRGFNIKIAKIPIAPQEHWLDATNLFQLWSSMLVITSSLEALNVLKAMRCCFIAFFICFSKVTWFVSWFINLKSNCQTLGTKSENFNAHLAILRNSDIKNIRRNVATYIRHTNNKQWLVISLIIKFVFVNTISSSYIQIKESSM